MTKNMPLMEFCEWYVYFYELSNPPQAVKKDPTKTTADEEIAFLKAQFSE